MLRRLSIGRFELALLAGLALLALAAQADMLRRIAVQGGALNGSDGLLVSDAAQYVAWVRSAGDHGLVANLFQIPASPTSYLHPGLLASGALRGLGLSASLAYLVWKPVAIVAVFGGYLLYVRRLLSGVFERGVALVLALFGISPVLAAVQLAGHAPEGFKLDYGYLGREMWPVFQLWGYLYSAVAIALMPITLLAYERARGEPAGVIPKGRLAAACAAMFACAWMRPWQGVTVFLIVVAAEVFPRADRSPARALAGRLLPLVAAAALPVAYYALLARYDPAWRMAMHKDVRVLASAGALAAGVVPFALPALLAYRLPARGFQERAVRWWPPVALLMLLLPGGSAIRHAMNGFTLPLAILAVTGVASIPASSLPAWLRPASARRATAVVAVGLFALPGIVANLRDLDRAVWDRKQAAISRPGEARAMAALDRDPRNGAVLAPQYIGTLVPGHTGRATFVGMGFWTPDDALRAPLADALFDGRLRPRQTRRLVRQVGAPFLLSDCRPERTDLTAALRPMLVRVRRFGCATIYEVRAGAVVRSATSSP